MLTPWFHLNATSDGVIFRAHCGGTTTKGSGYPRSELREMAPGGAERTAWMSSSGRHTLELEAAVTHLPVAKPHVVLAQIHDVEDDVIVLRLEGRKLFLDHNGKDGAVLTENYTLGDRIVFRMVVENDEVRSYDKDRLRETYPVRFSGAYFKAGAYVQSSCQGKKQAVGESCDAYGEVVIYRLKVKHETE